MPRMTKSELDLEAFDAEQMPGDVPEKEGRDGHGAEVEPPDAHRRARDAFQVALGDELVAYEAQQLHRPPWQHRCRCGRAPAERAQVRQVAAF